MNVFIRYDDFLKRFRAAKYFAFAILICIMIVVALLKIREVVFKNGLNNIPASGFIDWYMGVHTMFKQERQKEISFKR